MNYTDLFRATPSSMSEVGSLHVKVVLAKAERLECVELRVSTVFCMQTNSAYKQTLHTEVLFLFLGATRYCHFVGIQDNPAGPAGVCADRGGRVTLQLVALLSLLPSFIFSL